MALVAIAIVLFTYLGWEDFVESKAIGDTKSLTLQRKGVFISLGVIGASLFLVLFLLPNVLGTEVLLASNRKAVFAIALSFSFIISLSWYVYLTWLDIYEKEPLVPIIVTFVMASFSTFLVFPIGDLIEPYVFTLDGTFWNDLQYCIVNIGMVEELVKILPFIVILKLTKSINESYDYILYGGVCALGFAFVENTLYLRNTDLFALSGRSMYSTVSHMFDTGIICYNLAIAKYKNKSFWIALIRGYLIASCAHGFYDFWLISEGYSYYLVTIFFFLFSIHVFTVMKNNLINISEFYDEGKRISANRNKFNLFNLLLIIMFGGYVFVYLVNGAAGANTFLKDSLVYNAYVMVYIAVSFGSINVINGYIAPIRFNNRFFLPLVNRHPNYLGLHFTMKPDNRRRRGKANEFLTEHLPISGSLTKRVVVNGDFTWYYFTPLELHEDLSQIGAQMIVRPARFTHNMMDGKNHIVRVGYIKKEEHINVVDLHRDDCKMIGHAVLQYDVLPQ